MAVTEKLAAEDALALAERIYARLESRRAEADSFDEYYRGEHNLRFATDEWMKANADRYEHFSDNWCATVVDAENERLQVNGILLPSDEDVSRVAVAQQSKEATSLWEWWLRNEMDAQSSQGFLTSLSSRRSFVMVWADEDENPELTWEHPNNVEIEYDWMTRRRRLAGVKTWMDEGKEYMTLYTRHEVFKWERERSGEPNEKESQAKQSRGDRSTGDWKPRQFRPGEDDQWYGPNPLGAVPFVEIPNRPLLGGDPVSEVEKVATLQDAINMLWAYAMYAADFASMDARVLLGAQPPKKAILNDKGEVIGSKPITMKEVNEARMMIVSDPDAKIDSWKAADVGQFISLIEEAVSHIAAQTRTPPHYLVTNKGLSNLSGDALKSAEVGLVNKAREFQLHASAGLREVFRLMALVLNNQGLASRMGLATVSWKNAEIRSEAQMADALLKKRDIGYPFEYLMELDGIDPTDRQRILQMRAEEQREMNLAAAHAAMAGVIEDADPYGSDGAVPGDASGGDGGSGGEPIDAVAAD